MRLLKSSSLDKSDGRKQDTRDKIELGGLVVKAGLRHADRAFILGALIEAAALPLHSPQRHKMTTTGRGKLAARENSNDENQ